MKNVETKWIGLAEVVPDPGCNTLGSDTVGAFVNVVGIAHDEADFHCAVEAALAEVGLRLVHLEDVESYDARSSTYAISAELRAEAARVPGDLGVAFDTFRTFPLENN